MACAGGKQGLSQDERKFYEDMRQVHEQLKSVENYVNASKISKVRYVSKLNEIRPLTQKTLARYQATVFAERESYRALLRAYESYLVANKLWEEQKGLALVNTRMAEGANWLHKAENFINQEMKASPRK